jgi:hypothetical protein
VTALNRLARRRAAAALILMAIPGCHMNRNRSGTARQFAPCAGQRYLVVTNSTDGTYDAYLVTSPSSRIYMGTVYPHSRIDLPVDMTITGGYPDVVPVRLPGRASTSTRLGTQYATIVCR